MSQLLAKSIVKNKFWIVESQGTKIATIQAIENGGVVYVDQELRRSQYPTIKILSKEHNVQFDNKSGAARRRKSEGKPTVYGYPVDQKPHNPLWNVKYQFPVYTKSSKSKSFYCAGHYAIKINGIWTLSSCPKLITLNRYEFQGPFKTITQAQESIKAHGHN